MNNKAKSKGLNTRSIVGIAVFAALAYVVAVICQVIPQVQGFLSLDFKDAVIAISSFIYGPLAAVLISLIVALLELVTISGTLWYGFIMNFASSATFSLVACLIYRKFKSINGALISFTVSVIATVSVMLTLNIFVTPLYMAQVGIPLDREGVIQMIPKVLLPFNLAKSLISSALAMMLYKPMATAMRRAGFAVGDARKMTFNRASVVIISVGTAFIVAALILLLTMP